MMANPFRKLIDLVSAQRKPMITAELVTGPNPPDMGTQQLLEGYESMPWLRGVASKVGNSAASTVWHLYAATSEGKAVVDLPARRARGVHRIDLLKALRDSGSLREITDHIFFDALESPNDFMDGRGLLKLLQNYIDLVGDAFVLKQRNGLDAPIGFWPVPPHWVTETPTQANPTFNIQWRSWRATVPKSEVVWFHDPAPANPYTRGTGIGWALGDELQVDEYAAKMAVALFYNQARPDFVIYGLSDDKEKARLERDWMNRLSTWQRAHRPYFMMGEPKFHEFQRPDMQQLTYPGLRKNQRDIILQVWGVPPEIFGISEKGTLARTNYEGAEYIYSKTVIEPRVEFLRGGLQRMIAQDYDPRLILDFDSHIAADDKAILDASAKAPHARTLDEWRTLQGLPSIGGALGSSRLLPLNSYLTDDPLNPESRPVAAGGRPATDSPSPEESLMGEQTPAQDPPAPEDGEA